MITQNNYGDAAFIRCGTCGNAVYTDMDTPGIFEWDNAKAEGNLSKHGVRFEVASTVFKDPRLVIVETVRVQDGEDRHKAVGMIAGRLFTVVFVMRDGVCRIISARRANAGEERAYG